MVQWCNGIAPVKVVRWEENRRKLINHCNIITFLALKKRKTIEKIIETALRESNTERKKLPPKIYPSCNILQGFHSFDDNLLV